MKKKIVAIADPIPEKAIITKKGFSARVFFLTALAVVAGCFLFSSAVFVGVQMALTKRGPGPDWNIQDGLYQPTGDPAESARRSVFGAMPSTGHILWGSSFNENIAELDLGIPTPGEIVRWSDAASHSGPGSVYVETGPLTNDAASFRRLAFAQRQNRIGCAIHLLPEIDWALTAEREFYLDLEMNFVDMSGNNIYIFSSINIYRNPAGVNRLYYYNAAGAYVLVPGVTIPTTFVASTDAWPYTYWRFVKFTVDTSGSTPRYGYLDFDGHRYDLSALEPYHTPAVIDRSFIFMAFTLRTYEDTPAKAYVDDIIITDNEP
jgi:hypothetical protein